MRITRFGAFYYMQRPELGAAKVERFYFVISERMSRRLFNAQLQINPLQFSDAMRLERGHKEFCIRLNMFFDGKTASFYHNLYYFCVQLTGIVKDILINLPF